jgi:hypothetical protein
MPEEQRKISPDLGQIKQHLEFLFGNTNQYSDGKIEIAYSAANTKAINSANYFDVDEIDKAAQFAYEKNSIEGVNVYVGAALRSPDAPPFGRSSREDFYATTCVWVDIDDEDAANDLKTHYKDLPPSLVVVTGRHPHTRAQCWWQLDTPLDNPDKTTSLLGGLKHALKGDPAVVDAARIMRVGGSVSWPKKEGRVTELTSINIPENSSRLVPAIAIESRYPYQEAQVDITNDDKPRNPITGTLRATELLERTKQTGHWHHNMRDAVAHMVGKNWTNEQILMACAPYADGGAEDQDVIKLISTARSKFDAPDPDTPQTPPQPLPASQRTKLPLIYASDVTASLDAKDFVEDTLNEGEFSIVYGESNCGKTFFMMDMALRVALGESWRGKNVDQGGVIYAALEGGRGTQNRIAAFNSRTQINDDIPLAIIPSNINFLDTEGDFQSLIDAINEAKQRLGNIKLIVIDTLARAMSGSDENSGVDMGLLVQHADKLREMTDAHICFIHHSGKDSAKGARGHSSLRAAVDTEIEISRPDQHSASKISIVKQRELEASEDLWFSLERVVLGVNDRGKEVSSCVVVEAQEPEQKRLTETNANAKFIYESIVDCIISSGKLRRVTKDMPEVKCVDYEDLGITLESRGYKIIHSEAKTVHETVLNSTYTARVELRRAGKISFNGKYIWLSEDHL